LVWEDHFIKCLLKLHVFLIDKYMFICLWKLLLLVICSFMEFLKVAKGWNL
jgi:hypothetical protein